MLHIFAHFCFTSRFGVRSNDGWHCRHVCGLATVQANWPNHRDGECYFLSSSPKNKIKDTIRAIRNRLTSYQETIRNKAIKYVILIKVATIDNSLRSCNNVSQRIDIVCATCVLITHLLVATHSTQTWTRSKSCRQVGSTASQHRGLQTTQKVPTKNRGRIIWKSWSMFLIDHHCWKKRELNNRFILKHVGFNKNIILAKNKKGDYLNFKAEEICHFCNQIEKNVCARITKNVSWGVEQWNENDETVLH